MVRSIAVDARALNIRILNIRVNTAGSGQVRVVRRSKIWIVGRCDIWIRHKRFDCSASKILGFDGGVRLGLFGDVEIGVAWRGVRFGLFGEVKFGLLGEVRFGLLRRRQVGVGGNRSVRNSSVRAGGRRGTISEHHTWRTSSRCANRPRRGISLNSNCDNGGADKRRSPF